MVSKNIGIVAGVIVAIAVIAALFDFGIFNNNPGSSNTKASTSLPPPYQVPPDYSNLNGQGITSNLQTDTSQAYSQVEQIKLVSMSLKGATGEGSLTLSNSGSKPDSVASVSVPGHGNPEVAGNGLIAANSENVVILLNPPANGAWSGVVSGQSMTVTITMQSGDRITESVVGT